MKQKLYDLGRTIRAGGEQAKFEEAVLVVVTADDHLQPLLDETTGSSPLKNVLLEMVRNELQLDHYYVAQSKTILIRVNWLTLDNPVLRDD